MDLQASSTRVPAHDRTVSARAEVLHSRLASIGKLLSHFPTVRLEDLVIRVVDLETPPDQFAAYATAIGAPARCGEQHAGHAATIAMRYGFRKPPQPWASLMVTLRRQPASIGKPGDSGRLSARRAARCHHGEAVPLTCGEYGVHHNHEDAPAPSLRGTT